MLPNQPPLMPSGPFAHGLGMPTADFAAMHAATMAHAAPPMAFPMPFPPIPGMLFPPPMPFNPMMMTAAAAAAAAAGYAPNFSALAPASMSMDGMSESSAGGFPHPAALMGMSGENAVMMMDPTKMGPMSFFPTFPTMGPLLPTISPQGPLPLMHVDPQAAAAALRSSRSKRRQSTFDVAPFPHELLTREALHPPGAEQLPDDLAAMTLDDLYEAARSSENPTAVFSTPTPANVSAEAHNATSVTRVGLCQTRHAGTWVWTAFRGSVWVVPPPFKVLEPTPDDDKDVSTDASTAAVSSGSTTLPTQQPRTNDSNTINNTNNLPLAADDLSRSDGLAATVGPGDAAANAPAATAISTPETTSARTQPAPVTTSPHLLPRSPHEHRHFTVYHPPQAPDRVRLILVHYKCLACMGPDGDYHGDADAPMPGPSTAIRTAPKDATNPALSVAKRPADVKLGGMCCDLPWQAVAHVVTAVTGIKVRMVDVFAASQSGRCCLWLDDPAETDLLLRRLVGRLWMAPASHGYAVLAPDREAKLWLQGYLAFLRRAGITRVPFPRHLLTAERWRLGAAKTASAATVGATAAAPTTSAK